MDPSPEQEPLSNHSTTENSTVELNLNHTDTPEQNSRTKSQVESDDDKYCYSNSSENSDSPAPTSKPTTPELLLPLEPEFFTETGESISEVKSSHLSTDSPQEINLVDKDKEVDVEWNSSKNYDHLVPTTPELIIPLESQFFTEAVESISELKSSHRSNDSLPLEVSLRDKDKDIDIELKFNKNSDPLPITSDDNTEMASSKEVEKIQSPSENVFYSELRSQKPCSAPHSPIFPSKRKIHRKSCQEPPSLPEISPGRSSVFYAPIELEDKFDIMSGPSIPSQSIKSPPSKRHTSSLSSKPQYPTLFELSYSDSDSVNLSIVDRIEREYKIKEGTIKLFNAAKNIQQSMEAAKSYFTSNAKIIALLRKLQSSKVEEREQQEDKPGSLLSVDVTPEPSKATISISHIRIPLEWKEFDNIKHPIETGWVFCLFKLEGEVADTQTLISVDRSINDLTFPDVIIFPAPVSHEFRLEIEVYFSQGLFSGKDIGSSKGIRNRSKTKWSTDSISSQASSYDSPSNMPRYHLAGFSSLKLADLSEGLYTYKLTKGAVGSSPSASTHTFSNQLLPLWGQICSQIYVVPTSVKGNKMEGFVDIRSMVNESPVWKHYWCVLKQTTLFFWNAPEDVRNSTHISNIPLTTMMEVKRPRAEDGTFRKNSLFISECETKQHAISFGNKEERDSWWKELSRSISDLQVWRNYATKCQVVPDLLTSKKSFNSRTKRVASPIESMRQSITAPPESHTKRFISTGNTAVAKSASKSHVPHV
ncbi:Rhotekin-like isoform X2 [Oopsacas minuta]|uniref:Rhotekin-like isoform X2 n=1 Tax=Oopsacas minuta TaxID=111878 RepID=A0AAV7KKK9_9METZ|nr:Rhotekin-like isoform X2 [Oopsacas minuta]